MNFISKIINSPSKKDSENFSFAIKKILGFKPQNINYYNEAFTHSSLKKINDKGYPINYERLDFLGDAILGAVIAEFLFKKYPYKDEGFLTEIRSRIVKRETLNTLAEKIGLNKIVQFNFGKNVSAKKSIYGNALEAFIGAIYLDRGYKFCGKYILNDLVLPHINLQDIIDNNRNFKSILIEWAQKEGKKIRFDILKEEGDKHNKAFTSAVILDEEQIESGVGQSKKKAEQSAAEKSCMTLDLLKK